MHPAEPAAGERAAGTAAEALYLTRLEVSNLRILENVTLLPGPVLNLVIGANGSGKTSLLESIYTLCTGRSFRSRRSEEVIRRGAAELRVHGLLREGGAEAFPVGVEKRPGSTRIRLAEEEVRSASVLARRLPLVLVPPDSQRLVFDGAELRRRLLDWGLFHVEQDYGPATQVYRRTLQQRNALLRRASGNPGPLTSWDMRLEEAAARLHALRSRHLHQMLPRVAQLASELASVEVSIHYYPGWDTEVPLSEALAASLERDIARGHSGLGPHRADLVLSIGGAPAQQVLSRGEAKLVCLALWLAQARDYRARFKRAPLVLIDDLPAELDPQNRAGVLGALADLGGQSFITSVAADLLEGAPKPLKRFHVERGNIVEMV